MKRFLATLQNKPRLRRWCLAFCIGGGLLAVGVPLVLYWLAQEDRAYADFMKSGANINKMFKAYGKTLIASVESGNAEPLLAFYAEEYQSPGRGNWKLGEGEEINGIRHAALEKIDDAGFDRGKLLEELTAYVGTLASIKNIACKINLAEEIDPGHSARVTVKLVVDGVGKGGDLLQDRFFFRWWLRAVANPAEDKPAWLVVKDQLFIDPEVMNTRVSGAKPGFERLDLAAAGIDCRHRRDPNLDPESPTVQLKFAVIQHASGGVAATDYNGDGLTDLLFLDGVRSTLYRHEGIGEDGAVRFQDVTAAAKLDGLDRAHCGLFADFDNDGDEDLFVTRYGSKCRLYLNQGDGTFADAAGDWNIDFTGESVAATLLDYDRDGYIDIYVGVNGNAVKEVPRIPFFARNGQPNRLFRNVNGKAFEDVTEKAGVGDTGWSLAVCSGDLNGDGWPEIGVANDFGRKNLYRNNTDGTFTEIAKEAGTLDFSGGMGIVFGDVDGDGRIDIYTSNIYSNQRWLGERAALMQYVRNTVRSQWLFRDFGEFLDLYRITDGDWQSLGKMAGEGNSLFHNNGDGTFREVRESCTNRAGWGWSVALFDADNDADLDIYAANGWITGKVQDDL